MKTKYKPQIIFKNKKEKLCLRFATGFEKLKNGKRLLITLEKENMKKNNSIETKFGKNKITLRMSNRLQKQSSTKKKW